MKHISVLLNETVDSIHVKDGGVYIDCTFGGGGHTAEILNRGGTVFAFDLDPEAEVRAKEKFGDLLNTKLFLIHSNFSEMKEKIDPKYHGQIDGIIFDLGFSSFQIEDGKRGFAFMEEGPLDMRYDTKKQRLTAAQIVMFWDKVEIKKILDMYGEESFSERISNAIVREREIEPIDSTKKLAELIQRTIRKTGDIHPATKTFQALRIAVNKELDVLEKAINSSIDLLKTGGIVSVITFHSLEDRIVKWYFKNHPKLKDLTKKPISPSKNELFSNRRARSAKLRVAEKL